MWVVAVETEGRGRWSRKRWARERPGKESEPRVRWVRVYF
jgi:hypothetical protein